MLCPASRCPPQRSAARLWITLLWRAGSRKIAPCPRHSWGRAARSEGPRRAAHRSDVASAQEAGARSGARQVRHGPVRSNSRIDHQEQSVAFSVQRTPGHRPVRRGCGRSGLRDERSWRSMRDTTRDRCASRHASKRSSGWQRTHDRAVRSRLLRTPPGASSLADAIRGTASGDRERTAWLGDEEDQRERQAGVPPSRRPVRSQRDRDETLNQRRR